MPECELLGDKLAMRGGTTCYVNDEARVVVRYVFVFQPTATAPIEGHLEATMISAFVALSSGVV